MDEGYFGYKWVSDGRLDFIGVMEGVVIVFLRDSLGVRGCWGLFLFGFGVI